MTTVEVQYSSDVESLREQGLDDRMRQMAGQLTNWVNQTRAVTNRSSLFDRGKYTSSDNPYDQMRTARQALSDDDVVAGAYELTEGLAFQGIQWQSDDGDETDIFNQIAAEHDLDSVIRRMWREEFSMSQVVQGFWWDQGEFTVRGKTPVDKPDPVIDPVTGQPKPIPPEKIKGGNKRKKTYNVWYPRAITTLDSTKVVPVGMLQFGQERLAWQATLNEIGQYELLSNGLLQDELMDRFYAGKYVCRDIDEQRELTGLGVDVTRLILLDDQYVHRHTLTKPDHERFADVRLKSVFRLLDLKQQQMESDRVTLIGAANYILLVKKGTKEDPAYPSEIDNLQQNFNYIAKLPVIFSDHRLEIQIIAPVLDTVLNSDHYDVLDNRIAARLLNTITATGGRSGQRSDDTLKMGRLIARSMENRRKMIARYLEKYIGKAVYEHPKNKDVFKNGKPPKIAFVPGRIALDDDSGVAASIIQLRSMNELSRASTLEYFGFDQAVEAMRRTWEDESGMDDTFQTMVPFGSPGVGGNSGAAAGNPPPEPATVGAAQGANGKQGGRPAGGGSPSRAPAAAPRRTSKGTTSPKGSS